MGSEATIDLGLPTYSCTVAIVTYRRPDTLRALIRSLNAIDSHRCRIAKISIVNNDPAFLPAVDDCRYPIEIINNETNNIAVARNILLDRSEGDFLFFIDDDEVPCPDWIDQHINTQEQHGFGVSIGPVFPHFTPMNWELVAASIFAPASLTNHSRVESGGIGNAAIHVSKLPHDVKFDPRFGLTGGEDSIFLRSLAARRVPIVWAQRAYAHELTDKNRQKSTYIFRRGFQHGQTYSAALVEFKSARLTFRSALLPFLLCALFPILLLPVLRLQYCYRVGIELGKLSGYRKLHPVYGRSR